MIRQAFHDDRLRVGVDAITIDFVRRDPRHVFRIRTGHGFAIARPADEVDDDEVIADPAFRVAMDAIEGFDNRAELDGEARFLAHFAARGIGQRLAQIEQAARQRPLAFPRFVRAADDQRAAIAHHDRADADHRVRRVFSGHMKSHTEYLTFNINGRVGFENITPKVDAAVRKSAVKEGLVLVNAMHITASVFINDDEHGLHQDYAKWLEKLAPFDASPQTYAHNRTGEDNADAHMKRQVMGREVVVAITNGKLDFGPWEQIFYGEFDGNRNKRVLIKVIGD
jgi:secondary thiamine-phosphate synthase enzyme